jgi:hypothetical protein
LRGGATAILNALLRTRFEITEPQVKPAVSSILKHFFSAPFSRLISKARLTRFNRHPGRMKPMGHSAGDFNARNGWAFKVLSIDNVAFTTSVMAVVHKTNDIAVVL